jgi:hypothetical protein
MRRQLAPIALLGVLALSPSAAHHSRANFSNEIVVLDGEVVDFRWVNPHSLFSVRVNDASGKPIEWDVELTATPTLARSGWTNQSLKAGEHVTVRANPDRNPARAFAYMQSVLKDDGTVLSITPADRRPTERACVRRACSVFGKRRGAAKAVKVSRRAAQTSRR